MVGSLCDDAIVVVENCQSLMEREELSPKEAAFKCMRQITGAIIATTLVTVACYAPLAFYGGMVGNIYIQFAVSMCIALCLSTVVAMTLSPALCAVLLRRPDGHVPVIFRPFNRVLDGSRKAYSFFVSFLVRRALVTLLLFGGACCAVWLLFGKIDSSFLPSEDKGEIMCNIELPQGASVDRTDAVLKEFLERVSGIPGIRSSMVISGRSMMSGSGENVAMCILQLDAIMTRIQEETRTISDASIIVFTPPAIMGLGATGGATFELCGIGDIDAGELSTQAKQFAMKLSNSPETRYAMTSYNADTPQLFLDINREKAETLGVATGMIFSTLQSKLASLYVNDFTFQGRNYEVKIQSTADNRATLDNVREIQVPNDSGEMVPLSSIGTLHYTVGTSQITRFNKMTCAELNAQAAPGVSSQRLFELVEGTELPENYHVEWTGLSYQEKQNQGQIVYLMALALLFAYLFLVGQYESWMIPVPVMLAVVFAVLGALLGLLVTGETMSIYAQLGMVMLIGLAAKNAILMVEFSKQERESGKSIYEAALNGANLRYRAVLMTAWSFLFGVFPLVIATGAGSGSRRAIGITTFSGMVLATLVGIVFTPALYALFQRLREFLKKQIRPVVRNAEIPPEN